jgi:hypothetical protein
MDSSDYLAIPLPSHRRQQLSRQNSQTSVGSHHVASNSTVPRSLRVQGRDDSRYQRGNSDLEASIELDTVQPVYRSGFLASQGSQRSAQIGSNTEQEVGMIAGDSPKSVNGDDEEEDDGASIRTQRTRLERRDLSKFDVAALIINKVIGTGIFTTPGLVLSLTGSKKVSIILWFCGGIWSFLK